jgi:hypothetical protein
LLRRDSQVLIREVQSGVREECGISLSWEAALDVLILGIADTLADGEINGVILSPPEREGLETLVVASVQALVAS